ncbi:Uncharacterized protein Fot_29961 [Forsythia ovata]|uniref:Uncharacterized protein n=1 Tax=Forsythia ovata TaxID=205694 RepID=A0ABD1TU74_9LAMI
MIYLGFPPNFLEEYSDDKNCIIISTKRYFSATESDDNGLSQLSMGIVSLLFYRMKLEVLKLFRMENGFQLFLFKQHHLLAPDPPPPLSRDHLKLARPPPPHFLSQISALNPPTHHPPELA